MDRRALLFLHEKSLERFGGGRGMRDENLLDSALARPEQKFHYEPHTSIYRLAAAYCFGIARNHPFVDGNKRAAFLAAGLFLAMNGCVLDVDADAEERVVLAVVSGEMDEEELARWLEGQGSRRS